MGKKLYSDRIVPMDERILIRVPESAAPKGGVLIAEAGAESGKYDVKSVASAKRKNVGIVVAVGRGQRSSATGERIPIDPDITPGAEIHFEVVPGCHPFQPPAMKEEMEAEGLWFILESAVVCVLRPEGVHVAKRPVLV